MLEELFDNLESPVDLISNLYNEFKPKKIKRKYIKKGKKYYKLIIFYNPIFTSTVLSFSLKKILSRIKK